MSRGIGGRLRAGRGENLKVEDVSYLEIPLSKVTSEMFHEDNVARPRCLMVRTYR